MDFTFGISIKGTDALAEKLKKLDAIKYEEIRSKAFLHMWRISENATPVKTGALKRSRLILDDRFVYTAPYARYVEYGHTMPGGGYIPGQYYLKGIYDVVKPLYKEDLLKALKEGD